MTPDQYYGLIAVFLSICFGLLMAKIASDKGGSFVLWFTAGALLAIIALPLAIFLRPEQIGPASFKKCPKCAEQIQQAALICSIYGSPEAIAGAKRSAITKIKITYFLTARRERASSLL